MRCADSSFIVFPLDADICYALVWKWSVGNRECEISHVRQSIVTC